MGNDAVAYLPPDIAPFAALPDWSDANQHILFNTLPGNRTWSVLIKEPVQFAACWEIVFSTNLYQMVCKELQPAHIGEVDIRPLGREDVPAMLALTALTKPGPFQERTIEFGNYHGIFDGDELVAMTGERLHLPGYSEISAVCTHPDYEGRGYGALLVSMVADHIIKEGKTPFLHVKWDNQRAIKMYERLGFVFRSDIYFAVFRRR